MRDGAILSFLLHALVVLLLLVGLPNLWHRELLPPPIIPIDIVNVSDITQAPSLTVKPKADAPPTEVKEEKPITPPIKEDLPEPEPEPEKPVEPEPEPEPKPEPEPVVEKTPEPEPSLEDLIAAIPDEKPKEKPKEDKKKKKEKKKKKKKKDFMSLLNNIEKLESSSEGRTQPEQDATSTADHAANNISDKLSISELDLIRRQLRECWNLPAGAKDAGDLRAEIRIEVNPDATVRTATVVKTSKSTSDPHMRAFTDSALRAAKNPKCSPLKLPRDRYDQWKSIVIEFDPQHLF